MKSTTNISVSFPNIVVGCGHNNGRNFDAVGSSIAGLGRGSLSLTSQLGVYLGNRTLSYCLVDPNSQPNTTGMITFGYLVLGPNTVSTPLVAKDPETYYYVTLEAISVGTTRLAYNNNGSSTGNIIIDSGTTLTFFYSEFYGKLEATLEKQVGAKRVGDFGFCVKDDERLRLPEITVHFTGADMKLKRWNAFTKMDKDTVCLTMVPTSDIAICGNLNQQDFLVGYDLEKKIVFSANCLRSVIVKM